MERKKQAMAMMVWSVLCCLSAAPRVMAWPTEVVGDAENKSVNQVYFSGTNAYIGGHWKSPQGLKTTELWVNGICRYRHQWNPPYPTTVPLPPNDAEGNYCWMPFSTTQWADDTTLTLKATGYTPNGIKTEDIDTTHRTWNRAYIFYSPDLSYLSTRAGYASSFFSAANHFKVGPVSSATAEQIIGQIPQYSGFHGGSHGNGLGIFDTYYHSGDPWCDERCVDQKEGDTEISDAIALKDQAPALCWYNFVFLDACASAMPPDSYLISWFGSQSAIGWTGNMNGTTPFRTFAQALYSNLGGQMMLSEAAFAASQTSGLSSDNYAFLGGSYYVHRTYTSL